VIGVLLLLVVGIAFNLAGLFELPTPAFAGRSGAMGAFATGALAAFVATPCSGPFMAGALGAALVLPAAAALAGGVDTPVGLATHYHTFAVTPAWNRAMVMTDMVGAHLFHRWKGYWGTAAAMGRPYAGGESIPTLPSAAMATADAPAEVALPAMPVPMPTPPSAVARAATPLPSTPPAPSSGAIISDRLARSGEILDKWKDSGRPLTPAEGPRPIISGAAPR